MLKLTSLPSATVVKIAPDGASAAAGDTAIHSGNAATAATASQRMCALSILCYLPKSVVPRARSPAPTSSTLTQRDDRRARPTAQTHNEDPRDARYPLPLKRRARCGQVRRAHHVRRGLPRNPAGRRRPTSPRPHCPLPVLTERALHVPWGTGKRRQTNSKEGILVVRKHEAPDRRSRM